MQPSTRAGCFPHPFLTAVPALGDRNIYIPFPMNAIRRPDNHADWCLHCIYSPNWVGILLDLTPKPSKHQLRACLPNVKTPRLAMRAFFRETWVGRNRLTAPRYEDLAVACLAIQGLC